MNSPHLYSDLGLLRRVRLGPTLHVSPLKLKATGFRVGNSLEPDSYEKQAGGGHALLRLSNRSLAVLSSRAQAIMDCSHFTHEASDRAPRLA
jgi:hypothetical protein